MFEWPQSYEESYEHYDLPKWIKNLGVMSDPHIPYHSLSACDEALEYFIIKDVDAILLNGDVIDCYMLSRFQPDPRKRNFGQEIIAFQQFIKVLQTALPGVKIFFKLGNHEERYERIMISRCAEFLGVSHFDFENVLGCKELDIEVIKDQRIVNCGKLPIFHGHEVGLKAINVNPARSLFLKVHTTAACAHLHRTSSHTEPSLKEDITCWSFGHLGEKHPKFARNNKWNWGCARIEKNEDGDFEVININLTKNKLFRL